MSRYRIEVRPAADDVLLVVVVPSVIAAISTTAEPIGYRDGRRSGFGVHGSIDAGPDVLQPSVEPQRVLGNGEEAVVAIEARRRIVDGVHDHEPGGRGVAGGYGLAECFGEQLAGACEWWSPTTRPGACCARSQRGR